MIRKRLIALFYFHRVMEFINGMMGENMKEIGETGSSTVKVVTYCLINQ